jgi:hypothetical protein
MTPAARQPRSPRELVDGIDALDGTAVDGRRDLGRGDLDALQAGHPVRRDGEGDVHAQRVLRAEQSERVVVPQHAHRHAAEPGEVSDTDHGNVHAAP